MSSHVPEPTDRVGSLQEELAAMLGEQVERQVVDPMRRVTARQPRLGAPTPAAPPVELDPAVVDAITLAVDRSIEQLLPGLVEDALARLVPAAVEAAMADVADALAPVVADEPGHTAVTHRAAESLRNLRRAWSA